MVYGLARDAKPITLFTCDKNLDRLDRTCGAVLGLLHYRGVELAVWLKGEPFRSVVRIRGRTGMGGNTGHGCHGG